MSKKMFAILMVLTMSLFFISCQSDDRGKKSDSEDQQQNAPLTEKKENVAKKKSEGPKLNDPSKEIVYSLENETIKKMTDYSFMYEDEKGKKTEERQKVVMRFPQINLNSSDAKRFNKSMEEFVKSEYERYQSNVKEEDYWTSSLDYKYFHNDSILSVVLYHYNSKIYGDDYKLEENDVFYVKTVNFDPNTGNLLKDEEVLNLFKISDYESKILGYIHDFGQDMRSLNDSEDEEIKKDLIYGTSYIIGSSNTNLWRSLYHLEQMPSVFFDEMQEESQDREFWIADDYDAKNFAPQLYYDTNQMTLNAFLKLHLPAGRGFFYQTVDIGDLSPKEPQLNPTYEYYAKKLGIDIKDSNSPIAFSALLGYKMDENVVYRLQSIKENAKLDFEELISVSIDDYGDGESFPGDELFVLIPKYLDTSLSFVHLSLTPNGEEFVNTDSTYVGNIVLRCNPGDLRGNCEVQINRQDQLVKYQPSISLADGSNTVVDSVQDISHIIEGELPEQADEAYKVLEQFLGKG